MYDIRYDRKFIYFFILVTKLEPNENRKKTNIHVFRENVEYLFIIFFQEYY